MPDSSVRGNRLLAVLPEDDRRRIVRECEPVDLPHGAHLLDGSQPVEHVFFITDGLASSITVFSDGGSIESAAIGPEGCVGFTEYFGFTSRSSRVIQQIAGSGLRMRLGTFLEEARNAPALDGALRRYAALVLSETMQSAACNRLHDSRSRCARWLLLSAERIGRRDIELTHEFLSMMIGAGRPALSTLLREFESEDLITQTRGQVTIRDSDGLAAVACECYEVLRDQLREFSGPPHPV